MRWMLHILLLALFVLMPRAVWAQAEPEGSPLQRLMAEFGYSEDALDEVPDVQVAAAHALDERARASTRLAEVEPTRARMTERVKLLAEFAAEATLEPEDRLARVRRLALAHSQVASTQAEIAALTSAGDSLDAESALLGEVLTDLELLNGDEAEARAEQLALQEKLAEEEQQARRNVDEARRREEATKDAVLRQLFARERELREELVELATQRRELNELQARSSELADTFSATKGEILSAVDALPAEPTAAERVELVDPLLRRILIERRALWAEITGARTALADVKERVEKLADDVQVLEARLQAERGRERELGGGELWRQRVKVAETELELTRVQFDAALEREEQLEEQVSLLEEGVEFFSRELRNVVERASSEGRSEVYGLLNDAALSDAWQRLNDRYYGARQLIERRLAAGQQLGDEWLQLSVWFGGLLWRSVLAMVLMAALRFVPAVTRTILNVLQSRKFFRRRPSLAVKLFEILRAAARPVLLYFSLTIVLSYIIESLDELRFLQWGLDALFVYLIGARIAAAIALPRWYREREGLATTGGENDLRADEAAIADLLRLDIDRGTKFVKSARIVLLVGTVWYFAPSIVVAITGVSVLSGLITLLTRIAVVVVINIMLLMWRDELSNLFTRLAGDRIPKATRFVDRNKDRIWGVLVVAIVSVIVLVWEIGKFGRRALRNTDWFKRLSAYAFKTKIELQQRDESAEEKEEAALPADLEAAFGPREIWDTPKLVERESMLEVKRDFARITERGHGALCIVGEPGSGKTTTCRWLLGDAEHVELVLTRRLVGEGDLLRLFADKMEVEIGSFDALLELLQATPSTTFFVDRLERCFLRDISGYGAYQALMELIHRTGRHHIWLVAVSSFSWEFLTRVYDQRHVFHTIARVPRWSDHELRELVEKRMDGLPYTMSFTDLADIEDDQAEVVKTARGYYRYLAEFSRGIPVAAMHYWLRSLSGGARNEYAVGLFSRPSSALLAAAPADYRFLLAAVTQHGMLSAAEASRVDHTPIGRCELAVDYFVDAGALTTTSDGFGYQLATPFLSLTLRHLEDSNLL